MRPSTLLLAVLLGCGAPPPSAPPARPSPTKPTNPTAAALLPASPYLTSTRIAALTSGALVIDGDSGMLVKTDRDGSPLARLAIGRGAGTLAYDPASSVAFVADRAGDRVVVVDVTTLRVLRQWRTLAEPFGIALTPDRKTVLVSTIADRTLVAYDAHSGTEGWRARLGVAPRGIAISPDGARALITVGTGALDEVALDGPHRVTALDLDLACDMGAHGAAFARGSAVLFLDQYRAIASFQRAVPESLDMFTSDRYGGASVPPVTQHLSFLSFAPTVGQVVAQIAANQPRSMLWDRGRDTLYVAGFSSDTLLTLRGLTHATTDDAEHAAASYVLRTSDRCGPDGMAQGADGSLYVWCSFTRTVLRRPADGAREAELLESPPIADSSLPPDHHRGMVLFSSVHRGINRDSALACATCHTDGLADGLSWAIKTRSLQTPSLAGRVVDTAPYKWDGSDLTIQASIASTIKRLGGAGLAADQTSALVAYLAALPAPRRPTLDRAAVARGKVVFEHTCAECHSGPHFTDGARHHFESTLDQADTPSLIGVAASAPYYHDGSAPTLEALVGGAGTVHMADLSKLDRRQRADLVAFLASL